MAPESSPEPGGAGPTASPGAPTSPPTEVVYRWDLDKTYLQTDFGSLRGLWRAAVERPQAKLPVPGMRTLMTALSRRRAARIVVVSGSPTVLRGRIEAMFQLHGVRCDRLELKDFGARIARGRFRSIRAQVPYKLLAHLQTRAWLRAEGAAAPEICFGDDAEVDALVYCLYADIVSRRVDASRLRALLDGCDAYPDERDAILRALADLPREDVVKRVFIHLDSRSPPTRYDCYLGRVVPTFDAFQIATSLYGDKLCGATEVLAVAEDLVGSWRVDGAGLAGSLEDAVRRGVCPAPAAIELVEAVLPMGLPARAGLDRALVERTLRRLQAGVASAAPAPPGPEGPVLADLPYESLWASERAFAETRAMARRLARQTAAHVPGLSAFLESGGPHRG